MKSHPGMKFLIWFEIVHYGKSWVPFFFNGRFFDVLWLYQKKCVNLLILAVFLRQFHLPGNEHLLEEVRWSYFVHFWTLSTMVQNISLDHIKTAITGIRKSNKRPDCNAIHQYLKNKLEIHLTEDDIANKISFLLEKNILSYKCISEGD